MKIQVSSSTYNEISQILSQSGRKPNEGTVLSLEKDDELINPVDYKLATMRQVCCAEAAKLFLNEDGNQGTQDIQKFLEFADQLYKYVLTGTKTTTEAKGWK